MSVSAYFEAVSRMVAAETEIIRATFNNSTNKGNGFETIIKNFVKTYSPANFIVTNGEVVDTLSNKTGQLDLVIATDFHPKGHTDGRPNLVFYDMVCGLGEMKINLTKGELDNSVTRANAMSTFKRHPDNNNMFSGEFYGSNQSDVDQKPPPFFVVAFTSNISSTTLIDTIKGSQISLIVILEHPTSNSGIFVLGETHLNEAVENALGTFGTRKEGYLYESKNPLISLVWALNRFYVPFANMTNMISLYL